MNWKDNAFRKSERESDKKEKKCKDLLTRSKLEEMRQTECLMSKTNKDASTKMEKKLVTLILKRKKKMNRKARKKNKLTETKQKMINKTIVNSMMNNVAVRKTEDVMKSNAAEMRSIVKEWKMKDNSVRENAKNARKDSDVSKSREDSKKKKGEGKMRREESRKDSSVKKSKDAEMRSTDREWRTKDAREKRRDNKESRMDTKAM